MKKAISIWSFSGKTVKDAMALAKEAGYDGIELALNETGECSLTSTPEELADIRAYSEKLGLTIHSIATGLGWTYPITANDETVREKGIQCHEKQLEMAKALGADAILIIPGIVGADFIPGFEIVPYDVAYERAVAALNRIKIKAEALQIQVGVENVWNKFLLSPLEMRDFIDAINSPYVGAYLDVGNVLAFGYPEQWIHILGKRICKVHFKDYKIEAGGLNGFVDLLSGDVNWPAVMDAFRTVGYDGWVTAEVVPAYKHYPDQIIFNTFAAMKRIFRIKGERE